MMKQVASYKLQHNVSVLDREREEDLMKQSQQDAEKYFLDPSSVNEFIQTIVDICKTIQKRFMTDWLTKPETGWHPIHLDIVRDHIENVDRHMLYLISVQIHNNGGFEGERRQKRLERLLNSTYLQEADKKEIFLSITKIKKAIPDHEVS